MTWIYEALEMHDRSGKPIGKYRVVRWRSNDPELIQGLCDHHHSSANEALNCPVANRVLDEEFSDLPRLKHPKVN